MRGDRARVRVKRVSVDAFGTKHLRRVWDRQHVYKDV